MSWATQLYYLSRRWWKAIRLFVMIAGPGILVMVADNDAGGITTCAATEAKYKYNLIWFLIILGPVAYYVPEMTLRLGAVTSRSHFDGFSARLRMVAAALALFGVPAWLTQHPPPWMACDLAFEHGALKQLGEYFLSIVG